MARPGAEVEAEIVAFTGDVRGALGDRLVALVLHGSAAGYDWVWGRSDLNTAIVVSRVTLDVGNAGYWYSRAGRKMPAADVTLETEWADLARELLGR